MQLNMVGIADMRASMHIDDAPFLRRMEADAASSEAFQPDLPCGLIGDVAAALDTDVGDLECWIPNVPFSTWPLIGRGLEFRLSPRATMVAGLKDVAIDLIRVGYPNINYDIEVQRDPAVPTTDTITFLRPKLQTIVESADISIILRVYAVGFSLVNITVESTEEDFDTYWYPVYSILEAASYHVTNIVNAFDVAQRAVLPDRLGRINAALAAFREVICRYYPPAVVRETSRRQLDEIESGFEPVLRARANENWRDGFAVARAINSSGGMSRISTRNRDAYIGWAAIFFVLKTDGDGKRSLFNAELCLLIYSLFFFYERFLSEYLAAHVFSGKPISKKADVDGQRRFGDAIFYLADLERASNSGSDRVFYDAWTRVSKLDALRKKTSDGLDAVVDRLNERNKRRTESWAGRLALITGLIGLTSLMEFLNGLRDYLEEPEKGHSYQNLMQLKYFSPTGYDIMLVYGFVLSLIVVAWLLTLRSK